MSNIVLIFKDEVFLDYFSTLLTGVTDLEVIGFTDPTLARSFLSENNPSPTHLYLIQGHSETTREIIENILNQEIATPLLLVDETKQLDIQRKSYKSQTLLDYFEILGETEDLFKKIENLLTISSRSQVEKIYCKVNLSFFYSTKNIFCDVYIKIGEEKYLKVLNRYDVIEPIEIKKFSQKNIKYLYVRKRDFRLITKKLVEQIRPLQSQTNSIAISSNNALSAVFSIQLQETVSETIQKVGLSAEAVEMTNIAINSTMSLIERDSEIYQVLQNSIKGQDYSSEHSFLLSYLSCSLLKETSLNSPENLLALTIAAFFHDVCIDEKLCPIQTREEMGYKLLGLREQEEIVDHPSKSKYLVEKIEGIPRTVGSIIIQHHERYDGTGFPMGLNFKRISPLSAIFNIAHEVCQYIYESGNSSDNIQAILRDMVHRYPEGNYATAVQAAITVFTESVELDKPFKEAI